MKDWQKYARARDQIYHLSVSWRQLKEEKLPKQATPELENLVQMVDDLLSTAKNAFETGRILVLQLDLYEPIPLPGFEELHAEMKSPPDWRED